MSRHTSPRWWHRGFDGKNSLSMSLHIRVSGMRKTVILGEYDLDTKRVRLLPRF